MLKLLSGTSVAAGPFSFAPPLSGRKEALPFLVLKVSGHSLVDKILRSPVLGARGLLPVREFFVHQRFGVAYHVGKK
jgi:hypothetical protein